MQMYQNNTPPLFKCRCSAIGLIMTEPRGKSVADKIDDLIIEISKKKDRLKDAKPGLVSTAKLQASIIALEQQHDELVKDLGKPNLSETCKSYLKKWLFQELSGKRIQFTSAQTEKGNMVEDDAILYFSTIFPEMALAIKNTRHFENEYLIGTPDVLAEGENRAIEYVFDAKSSYNAGTFPAFEDELPEDGYDWQERGYMSITEAKKGAILYGLMSTPDEILERQAKYALPEGYTREQYEEWAQNYKYDNLPAHLRVRRYDIEYSEEKELAIYARIKECRTYIEEVLWPMHLGNKQKYQ